MMRGLLRACHLQPTLAVTAISTALALSVGRGVGALAVFFAVLAGQLSVGWSNDYLDRERDRFGRRVDKPIVAGDVDAGVVRLAALCAVVACVPLSFLSGWRAALVHLVAVGLGWAYNAGLKRTVLSVVPYAVAFGALPAFVTLGLPSHPWPPVWAVGAAAALGSGAHFVNTLADRDADAASGVRGLPQRLPVRLDLLLAASLLGISLLLLWRGPVDPPGVGVSVVLCLGGLSVVAVVVLASVDRPRLAWSLTLVTAVAAVAALVASGDAMGVAG